MKLQTGFPWQALQDGLDRTNTRPEDLAVVAYPFLAGKRKRACSSGTSSASVSSSMTLTTPRQVCSFARRRAGCPPARAVFQDCANPNEKMGKGFAKTLAYKLLASEGVVSRNVAKRGSDQWGREASTFHRKWQQELEGALEELGLRRKLKRVEHHVSHAANAYYTSGFDEALIVTLDGYGSRSCRQQSAIGRGGQIERVHGLEYPALARHVLRVGHVGARLQAEPARGQDRRARRLRRSCSPSATSCAAASCRATGGFRIVETNNIYFARLLASQFPKIDVAAAYQRVLEEVATAYVVAVHARRPGLQNLVLSGGVVANVKLNQRLREIARRRGHLHPPEHGRRRLRHRRGAARVRRDVRA